jgi:hypothetical protein
MKASMIEEVARSLFITKETQSEQGFVAKAREDLAQHRGSSVVIPGDHQPPVVHALAHELNELLGNAGSTVYYTEPVEANPVNQTESLRDLCSAMAKARSSSFWRQIAHAM